MKYLSKAFFVQMSVCIVFLLSVAGCSREPEKLKEPPASAKGKSAQEKQKTEVSPSSESSEVVATTTLLATISDDEKPVGSQGPPGHTGTPSQGQPAFTVFFSKLGGGAAYIAERAGKVHVVHNGKPGRHYDVVDSYTLALSPDGRQIAYGAKTGKWLMVIDGREEGPFDSVGSVAFSPDSRHIAYEAQKAGKWHIVVDNKMNAGCPMYYDRPVFSGDSTKIFFIENTEESGKHRLIVSDLAFKKQSVKVLRVPFIVTNEDKTRIAAIEDVIGKQRVIEFDFNQPDAVKKGALYDSIRFPAFGADGVSVSYAAALRGGKRFLILNNREERLPDDAPMGFPVVRPDKKGAGIIMSTRDSFYLHQAFYNDGTKKKYYDEAAELTYNKGGTLYAYAARKGRKIFVVVNGKEGPAFDQVIKPQFSPDGRRLVYLARKGDKRFVVVADANGKTVRQHPGYERVFDPVFTADGKSVAYGVKDGNKLTWKVEKM